MVYRKEKSNGQFPNGKVFAALITDPKAMPNGMLRFNLQLIFWNGQKPLKGLRYDPRTGDILKPRVRPKEQWAEVEWSKVLTYRLHTKVRSLSGRLTNCCLPTRRFREDDDSFKRRKIIGKIFALLDRTNRRYDLPLQT